MLTDGTSCQRGGPMITNTLMAWPYTFKTYSHVSHKVLNTTID